MANVLFFAEARDGELRRTAFEAATAARALATALGGESHAVLIGENVMSSASALAECGTDHVHVADGAAFARPHGGVVAEALREACGAVSPAAVVVAGSALGKDAAPRLAAMLGVGYVSDAIEITVDGGRPRVRRPMYASKVRASCRFEGDGPHVIGIRPNVFTPAPASGAAAVATLAVTPTELAGRATITEFRTAEGDKVDLGEARTIVSGGRGVKGPENFPIIQALADALGGAMGASRAAVDAGWIDHSHQVGQTGRTVSPDLYIACGISGAIQHLAGMSSSRVIVAINKDPEAPIFKVADYGIVGDLFEIVPKMTEKAKAMAG